MTTLFMKRQPFEPELMTRLVTGGISTRNALMTDAI
jgi:hypothetical protein